MSTNLLRSVSVAVLLVTAGCLGGLGGFVSGDQSLSFSAGAISIPQDTVSESPYTLASDKSVSFNQSIEAAGESRTVEMNVHMLHLKRSYQGAPLASVVALSVPQVEVLGQQINMTEQMDPASLIGQASSSSGELQRDQKIGEKSVRIMGQNRTVEVFSGTATRGGQSAKAKIYVVTFDHEGDTIVAAGIVPQVAENEGSAVVNLLESLQYEG
ncbi:MAG: DUF6517 family protein [Halobacteriales archaeon]